MFGLFGMADPDFPSLPPETPGPTDASLDEQARQWLLRLRSGKATAADARAFARWRSQSPAHEAAVQQLARVLHGSQRAAARIASDASVSGWRGRRWRAWRAVGAGGVPPRRAFLATALGAGAAWMVVSPPLGLWPSVGELAADFRTGAGEQRELALDGSLDIAMNTRTRINLGRQDDGAPRIELVAGEAEFFAHAPGLGAARAIQAGTGVLKAQMARLNVRHLAGSTQVSCLEGQVDIYHPTQHAVLGAGQQLSYDADTVAMVRRVDAGDVSAWRQGILQFDDASLTEVVDELNRYRQGRILLRDGNLAKMRVQARFSVARLDEALNQIRDMAGGRMTRLPGGIVLLG